MPIKPGDWGVASVAFDDIKIRVGDKDLSSINEAQTRFDVIDGIIRQVLGWAHGTVSVEEYAPTDGKSGYVDYLLRLGDVAIVLEAKRIGASFPTPTENSKLKLSGTILSSGPISAAISQAKAYSQTKEADVTIVTNGLCWCFFNNDAGIDDYATILFPFTKAGHAEELYNYFSSENVALGSTARITNQLPHKEERLINAFDLADDRVDRNNIADHIMPALDKALYAEALLNNVEALRRCFVSTEARTKFDATLGMHLADPKPKAVAPAKRITRDKKPDHLDSIISNSQPSYAPPVTLIIGPVGAGKSTYLKHFELVSGSEILARKKAHWIYVDMEAVGKGGNPRDFMYAALKAYIGAELQAGNLNYDDDIYSAYADEIDSLLLGPLKSVAGNQIARDQAISQLMMSDYGNSEPYVDKVVKHIANKNLAIIVLDNIDLYEDEALETTVFAEGLALSKRVHCHVIVSVRDTTFVRHKNDSAFNAYELRKLWLDPPPLKAVVSARFSYSKKILEKKSASIDLPNNKHLQVDDLSIFFDIVQQSILRGQAGDYIEAIADLDIRKGLNLIKNFLTSGHVQADQALGQYLLGNESYFFPFHEIFKGSMLGQWTQFQESRAEGVNIFDSQLGSRRLRLLRCFLLQFLLLRARSDSSMEVSMRECCDFICPIGATAQQVEECLSVLHKNGLVRTTTSESISPDSTIVASRSGGYYMKQLSRTFVYVEECMYDTAIDAEASWRRIHELTGEVLREHNKLARMNLRKQRVTVFLQALQDIENEIVIESPLLDPYRTIPSIRPLVLGNIDNAIRKIRNEMFPVK